MRARLGRWDKRRNGVRFEFRGGEFTAGSVGEWDEEEFILADEDHMVVGRGVELVCCVRGFGWVAGGVESVREESRQYK